MDLTVSPELDPAGRHVLHVAGALDVATRDALLAAADATRADADATAIILEMSQITFIDSSGIGAIVTIARDTDDNALAFALQSPSERVTRILRIAGLYDLWTIESGVS